MTRAFLIIVLIFFLLFPMFAPGQVPGSLDTGSGLPLKIDREAIPTRPFTVTGPRGAILGQQDGSFEAWIFPWKIFSNLRMTVEMQDYPVPIDVNEQAAAIEVRPDHTVITFAHANFTIKEVLFALHGASEGAGVLAFFQLEAVRPMALTIQFTPEMKQMWPASSDDRPSPEWIRNSPESGFYILHLNFPDHAAAIAIPGAQPGILPPYQERPKTYPLQFLLHFDPARDGGKLFPLLITVGNTSAQSSTVALKEKLANLENSFHALYSETGEYFRKFLSNSVVIETPDAQFNDAFLWAEVSIDQLKVETVPSHKETALVAGFYGSGESARPGFGWFFGRDALWTLYAVNSYGDFQLARDELEFLLHRQRQDGKIIHEWSQTSDFVDWKSLPYEFASSDATPLLLMAANDYFQISHDAAFLGAHWQELHKAWDFECSHDSDGDGIYENTEGSGWVESWIPTMPHQEIYLAALDQQASSAFSEIARVTGHAHEADQAHDRAVHIAEQLEKEYYSTDTNFYAFSRNTDGSLDTSPTIYPAVADWDGTFRFAHPSAMISRWASQEFSTDWGTRDLSPTVSFYDPISYHQGSVWPLFTGWVALSEYRNGRSLSGFAHLMQNADLTWAQDLGAVTELLSGEFFRWFGRSTSHQLWSSAMVVTPTLRGLFGLAWNADGNTLSVTPSLPAQWDQAKVLHLPVGNSRIDLEFKRRGLTLAVRILGFSPSPVKLISRTPGARVEKGVLLIPLSPVEVGISHGLPSPGSRTMGMKVLDQHLSPHSLELQLAAPAGTEQTFFVRMNDSKIHPQVEGGELPAANGSEIHVRFPSGQGYVEKRITLSW